MPWCGCDDLDDQQNHARQRSPNISYQRLQQDCGQPPPQPQPVVPRLLSLDVENAVQIDDAHYWETVNLIRVIRVTAVTDPPNTPPNWAPGLVDGENGNVKLVTRALGTTTVTATLDRSLSVEIKIYDLTDMTCPLPAAGGHRWKAYVSGDTTVLTAVTSPDTDEVWPKVRWTEGAQQVPASGQAVNLTPVGDRTVTASLGQTDPKTVNGVLHICQWPVLEVASVNFGGYPVENDTFGAFDQQWLLGRLPALQSPICYPRNTQITLNATFNVTTHPTDTETVQVRGRATVGLVQLEWLGSIDVAAVPATVDLPNVDSDNPIPDVVRCYDPMTIAWEMTRQDGTWMAIGNSSNVLYATLDAPNTTPAYWTLLDISCRQADGAADANALVAGFYPYFTAHAGTGRGMPRKRDGMLLSYWLLGLNSAEVFETAELLASADGSGRCGSWARFMIDMCRVHGVMTADLYGVVNAEAALTPHFLVVHHNFPGPLADVQPLPYEGAVGCTKGPGAAGQGFDNPEALFDDHALVMYNGQIYDPSYGTGPYLTLKAWEDVSISGLGRGNLFVYPYGGVDQAMAPRCGPRFRTYTVVGADTMDTIAVTYAIVGGGVTLFNAPVNAPLRATRATAADVQAGDTVYIPCATSNALALQGAVQPY